MSKALDKLEEAREAMHADRNSKTIAAYKAACKVAQQERSAERWERESRAQVVANGDAAPRPDTLIVDVGVNQ